MASTRWKRHEREIAQLLGGVRLPNNGRPQADVVAGNLAVQIKTRTLPAWLLEAMDQAQRDAAPDQLAALILSAASPGRKARRLLVLDLSDAVELLTSEDEPR